MPERAAASDRSSRMSADSAVVFAEFQRRLRAFVSRRVRNAADVEDIVQETFLRIHRHLAEVRGADRLAAWVFQVARSAMVDHFRRQRHPGEALSEEHELLASPDAGGGSGPASEFEELAACLAPMIESLPPADHEAIDLSEIKGFTQRQASTRVGVTLSGMKSRVQRARRKLKAMLLDCCRIELDRRGGIVGHEPRDGACDCAAGTEGKQPKWK
jgi:RNA polymerase sigma-70 factor (ECF subfamily)